MLRADTKPHGRREFRRVPAEDFQLYVSLGVERHEPETLEISAHRFPRRSLSAHWNGCPWVM